MWDKLNLTLLVRRLAVAVCAVVILASSVWPTGRIFAQAVACTVTISPNIMDVGANANFSIDVTNTGSNDIQWIDFTVPSGKFFYAGNSISGSWTTADHGDGTTVMGGTITSGATENFQISVRASVERASSENWNIRVSDDSGGADPQTCGGSLGASITGHMPQDAAVSVTDVAASDITASGATITWNSDMATSSMVYFGTTSAYEATSSYDSNLVTQHSVTLAGLNAGMTYHFQVAGDDGGGTIAYSMDNTFITAQAPGSGQGTSTTPPVTLGPNKTSDDPTPPLISVTTKLAATYQKPPIFQGTASDNKGIALIEYSTDGGKNWLPVDSLKTAGAQKVTFSFTPLTSTDGNYSVIARAVDTAGNITLSEAQTMVIDRLPPVVGGTITSLGPQIIQPNEQGTIRALMGADQQITLNAVGGAISIVIEAKNPEHKGAQSFSMTRSADTGLWVGSLAFQRPGTYALTVRALDGAGNKTERSLNTVIVDQPAVVTDVANGKPLDASVTVYYRDPDTNAWVLWDGEAYGQTNPLQTKSGKYGVYLPAGVYYLKAHQKGYKPLVTKSISIDRPTIVSSDMRLARSAGVRIGKIDIRLPDLGFGQASVSSPQQPKANTESDDVLRALPQFSLPQSGGGTLQTNNLYGKPTVMSFISTWAPPARDQIAILATVPNQNINVTTVSSGEDKARVTAYIKIAGYGLPVAIDPNNQLIAKFGASNLPTHYFIDRHGDIKKVMVGVLSKEEILRYVADGL